MTVAFMVGIAVHDRLFVGPTGWMILLAISIAAAIGYRGRQYLSAAFLLLATFLAGVSAAQLETFYFASTHIAHYATDQPRLAQLEMRIDAEPRILVAQFEGGRPLPPRQVTQARVTRVLTWNGWREASGEVLVQIAQPHPRLAIGQTVRAVGKLERPSPAVNPGQFDWAEYYREQRILCSVQIASADNVLILDDEAGAAGLALRADGDATATQPSSSSEKNDGASDGAQQGRAGQAARLSGPWAWWQAHTRQWLAAGFTPAQSLDHALLRALVLGDSDPQLRDVQDAFQRTGTSHHLAISGMHVAILGGVVFFILRLCRVPPATATVVGIVAVVLYGAAALPSPPVVRSVLLAVIAAVGYLRGRGVDWIQLLAVSVFAMLIYHPLDLFNAGFQLSFGTVLGLMIFSRPTIAWATSKWDPDAHALRFANFRHHSRRDRFYAWLRPKLIVTLATGAIAWLVSMPLIAFHFGQLNPWAIPASILLAGPVLVALIGGFAKIALTLLLPIGAPLWALLAAVPMHAVRSLVELLAKLPGADVPFPKPAIWMIVAYYALLLLPLLPSPRPAIRWIKRTVSVGGLTVVALLPLSAGAAEGDTLDPSATLTINLLAVGAGQCAVVDLPDGRCAMFDCGSDSLQDPIRKAVAPVLRQERRTRVDLLVLSHTDHDHVSGAAELIADYGVRVVVLPPRFREFAGRDEAGRALLRAIDESGATVHTLHAGESLPFGGARLEALWPGAAVASDATNENGLVLELHFAGQSVLFTGDIQGVAESGLVEHSREALHADVLIAPHHGSSEQTTAAFLKAVDPSIILASSSRRISAKQKRFDRLIGDVPLYRTNDCGAITVHLLADGGRTVKTFLKKEPRLLKR